MRKIVFTDNQALLEGLRSGNEAVFCYIFNKYYSAIRRNILKLVADENVVEDLLQECFITLWEKRNELQDTVDLGGWLFNTSYYKSISWIRNSIKLPIVNKDTLPEHIVVEENDHEIYHHRMSLVHKAIEALPQQRQKAVLLCKLQGASYEDVAREMNLSEATIRQYVKLSMASLKSALNNK